MTKGELEATGLDLWLLGHTHVRFPDRDRFEGDRVLFPATPEPDGFDCRHAGHAWIIELEADGTVRGESVRTGTHRFRTVVKTLANEADLEAVKTEFATFSAEEDLVKLILSGRLPGELFESRGEWLAALEKSVLYLESDLSDLHREIRGTDIGREFTIGSFPQRLLGGLAESGAEADALQLAWDIVKEARS
jgi:hypothetical protein